MASAGGDGDAEGEVGQPDAVLLAPLTEETFLHNLHVRYKQDIIYTYVGNALVSVNPGRALPLYSPELVRSYLTRPPYTLPPHIYAIAATAYRWVRDRGEYQCIVMTGDSGAGKTEAARVCLQCVVLAGGAGGQTGAGGAGGLLTAAGTLLEAFGNAATARNHNASRFSRASGANVGGSERNYHVLYQLLAGADAALLKRLKLQRSWLGYRVLAGGGGWGERRTPPPRRADKHAAADTRHFTFTTAAMETLGVSSSERNSVLRVLAFILKLGNVSFEPEHNIDGSLGARLLHHNELEEACSLVGVCARELAAALQGQPAEPHVPESCCSVESSGSGSESEWECGGWGAGGAEWARARRDRLLATLYQRLFTWLVNTLNRHLQPSHHTSAVGALGILDVYGLESLSHNGLERLLINYAAERVHAAVRRALISDHHEYIRERLPYRPPTLQPPAAADLLDQGPESVLALVETSSVDSGATRLLAALSRSHHSRLCVLPPSHFQVLHFSGAVVYSAAGMAVRNRDALCPRARLVLAAAADPLMQALFPPQHNGGGAMGVCVGLCGRQRALVGSLCRRMLGSSPRLVRCLLNHPALRPAALDTHQLQLQLHHHGIVEMAQVRRAGWCEGMCVRELVRRYGVLAPRGGRGGSGGGGGGSLSAARDLLRALPIPAAEFAFGRTKVFFRSPRTVWELEALRAARVEQLVAAAQRAWRRYRDMSRPRRDMSHARRDTSRPRRDKSRLRRDKSPAAMHRAQRVIARAYRAYRKRMALQQRIAGSSGSLDRRRWACGVIWRAWCVWARRHYLQWVRARLAGGGLDCPAGGGWGGPPHPALTARADRLLAALHHRWRCAKYRMAFDQTARNRMREKVTASILFRGRKSSYASSVGHPFVGDYVRLRAAAGWRRGPGATMDRYVVFADIVRKVSSGSGSTCRAALCVVSTHALLLLDPRSLRVRRRVPAQQVYRLSLSPLHDDLLAVHVRACGGLDSSTEELSQCSARDAPDAGCLFGEARGRRGDVLLRALHVLELATKLFLVVQHAAQRPPAVHIHTQFEVSLGGSPVTVSVCGGGGGGGGGGGEGGAGRLVRRGSRLDLLL